MIRKIIKIDENKCNGCGACAKACHEGAIEMIDGKARLTKESHCDGLGDCLPACPTGAISFELREAPAYDEAAVKRVKKAQKPLPRSCSGIKARAFAREDCNLKSAQAPSRLMQWPCQIKLVPPNAPYLDNANLLIAADCVAYAYGSFHNDFMKNRITLIGCPKLDMVDYGGKLLEIISRNSINSVTVVKMEVPCCRGIEVAVREAIKLSGKFIPLQVITVTTDGKILD